MAPRICGGGRMHTYPCQGILLLRRKIGISEKKSVVLEGDRIRDGMRDFQGRTHRVKKSFDFSKFSR
jgi:hypothetical protein